MQCVGLDVHKHKVYGVIMTEQGKIIKEGLFPNKKESYLAFLKGTRDKWIRWVLIQCIHIHIKYDTHLTQFYYHISHRRGKKIAIVATASKFPRVIDWMLKNKEEFHPLGLSRTGSSSIYLWKPT